MFLYDALSKLKLTNFVSVPKSVNTSGRDIALKTDRNLFGCLLVIVQLRDIDLRDVFKYCLGRLPWLLTSTDGTLGKTDKSKLLELLTN